MYTYLSILQVHVHVHVLHVHSLCCYLKRFCSFRGEALPGEDRLLSSLPQSLQEDVGTEECSELLSNVVFFQHTDTSFLRQLSLKTITYLFAPGDIVLYYGDIGREMYCVKRGYVEVMIIIVMYMYTVHVHVLQC